MSAVHITKARIDESEEIYANTYIFECPHCEQLVSVAVSELNCHIFRHGTYKSTLEPIHPHLSKEECEKLVSEELVYGCCKPFRIVSGDPPRVEICDYI